MMEDPEQDVEPLPSFIQTISEMQNAGVESEPHQEPEPESDQETPETPETQETQETPETQETQETPETQETQETQETPEPPSGPLQLEHMESRRQRLRSRQEILQKMQKMRKTAGGDRSTHEGTSEDSEEVSELENIQKELQELLLNKMQLKSKMEDVTFTANRGPQDKLSIIYKTEPPCGGIYTLPPPQEDPIEEMSEETTPAEEASIDISEEETSEETPPAEETPTEEEISEETPPAEETPTGPIIPVESLAEEQAFTRCPSCEQIVFTKTRKIVGETIWLLCCMWTLLGCVAGCCLTPFCMNNLKDIEHRCPKCKAHIHTYKHY